ncbi:hypothetical protein HMI55_005421 [Coelomomyces lativittatus]|nr:hypothetical protein HMI55_005421 [Coelomomyces lativittatus]
MNEVTASEHIELLAQVASDWLKILPMGVKKFVKVQATVSLGQVKDHLEKAIKQV